MKKRIIAMVLSVAMMLTMFPTGVLADDFVYEENTANITDNIEGQGNENQGEGEPENIVNEDSTPAETEDQATDPVESTSQETAPVESESQATEPAESTSQETAPVESASQETQPVESESQTTDPAESASQATDPVESESQAAEPAASASQAAEPEKKDNSVNTADLYNPQPTDITAEETKINVGQTMDLTGSGVDGYGGTPVHQWSTEDETVATVSGDGAKATVTGVGVGKTKISHYYYRNYYGFKGYEKTETIEIEVVAKVTDAAIRVEGEASTTTPLTLPKHAERQLKAVVVNPTDAAYKSCAWSVDDSDVLTVAEDGAITAKGVGEATVKLTVTNYDDSEVTAELPVTVTAPVAPTDAKFVVDNQEVTSASVTKGKTIDLTAKILPEDAQGYTCNWKSSDDTKATVAPVAGDATKATVTGVEPTGETPVKITLTVTPENAAAAASADEAANGTSITKTIEITVTDLPKVTEVTINGADTVTQFQTIQLTHKIVQQAGAEGYTCEWSSDNQEILSVDRYGVVTGKRQGTATVTLTVTNPDDTKASATKSIEVVKNENPDESNKAEAAIFCLISPTANPDSNAGDQWLPNISAYKGTGDNTAIGFATVNVEGANWIASGDGDTKNCTDNVDQRVVRWPNDSNQIQKNSAVWNAVVANYKTSLENELHVTIEDKDIESITLKPFKISKDNGAPANVHLDCKVDIKCKNVCTATYKVMDAGSEKYRELGSKNYKTGESTKLSDVTNETFDPTKTVGGVTYTFSGWYLDREYQHPVNEFPYTLTQNTTFYAKYEPGYNVNYELEGGTWNETTSERVIAGRTYWVKGMSEANQPTRPGYTFAGWTVDGLEGVSEYKYPADTAASFTMPGNNVTLTAKWKSNAYGYTVKYVDESGKELQTAKTGSADFATVVKAEDEKIEIPGYTYQNGNDVTIGLENNVMTLVYKANAYDYTVKYVDESGKELQTAKTGSADFATVVKAEDEKIEIPGYTYQNGNDVTIGLENNVMTLVYAENVTLVANSDEVVYDGNKHSVSGYVVKIGDVEVNDATFANITVGAEGTAVGTYPVEFAGTVKNILSTDGKYIVTEVINGSLVITAQSINPTPDPEKPDEKDPAYGGVQIDSPSDSVYDGTEHKWVPTVLDKDGKALTNADYKVTYSTDNFTDVTGTITVTITGEGNYTGTVTRTYKITPAPLKITTNSAEKTYDGSALTAGGKIEGLVKGETATLKTTGSQTEVGESKNTYEIKWDGSAKEANYKIAEEDIGTLKVNARSGGGSSSKPTPEDEPTPTPTPTPLPTLPTTPAPTTPTRRVTRSTATVTQPTSRPSEQITENETPKAESEPEVIEDEETPLAPMAGGAWALVNLILMLLTVLASLLLLLGYLGKKKYAKEDEYGNALHDANGNEIIDYTRNKKGFWRVASLISAIAAVIAFALTENMRLPMVMTDRWTLLMVIIAVVQLIVAVLCKKKKESEEDENQANA